MKKKNYIVSAIVATIAIVAMVVACWFVNKAYGQPIPDWAFGLVGVLLGVGILIVLVTFVTYKAAGDKTQWTLRDELENVGFNVQRSYVGTNPQTNITTSFFVDFDAKQFASNEIYHYVAPFKRLVSGRIELTPIPFSHGKNDVHYLISILRKDTENTFDYIEMLSVLVDDVDLEQDETITESMVSKYPALQQIIDLDTDVKLIMQINADDGVGFREPTEEELAEYENGSDSGNGDTDANYDEDDSNSNEEDLHYTKPPFHDAHW